MSKDVIRCMSRGVYKVRNYSKCVNRGKIVDELCSLTGRGSMLKEGFQ